VWERERRKFELTGVKGGDLLPRTQDLRFLEANLAGHVNVEQVDLKKERKKERKKNDV